MSAENPYEIPCSTNWLGDRASCYSERHTFGTKEFSGDVKILAADHDDLLSVEELLGHSTSQATEQMSLAVNDNL